MDTNLSLYEIELIIAKWRDFDYTKRLVVFNVHGSSGELPIWHECDVLVCSKAGYLTEIEIKRSYSDFLADFKKKHDHKSEYIKYFYYCVPEKIKERVVEFLNGLKNKNDWRTGAGVISFRDEYDDWLDFDKAPKENKRCAKLNTEQMLYLARMGSMRVITLKKKIIETEKKLIKLENMVDELNMENSCGDLEVVPEHSGAAKQNLPHADGLFDLDKNPMEILGRGSVSHIGNIKTEIVSYRGNIKTELEDNKD